MEGAIATGRDQNGLLVELAQAREKLERLVGELRAIDSELDELATERKQHGLLQEACRALQ